MQKKVIALAVAALASSAAFAQTNVTIYGVADVGVEFAKSGENSATDNPGRQMRVQSGQSAGSRIGFKGEEALGNGLTALFQLEMGVALDTGSTTQHGDNGGSAAVGANVNTSGQLAGNGIFQRQAFAGLKGGFGQLTFGKQYTPFYAVKAGSDAFGLGLGGTLNNLAAANPANADRLSNMVLYVAPTMSGFTVGAGYSSGAENNTETTADLTTAKKAGKGYAALAQYANGPIFVGLAYHNVYSAAQTGLAGATNNAHAKGWMLGGSYDFGVAKVFANYSAGKANQDGVNTALNGDTAAKGKTYSVGVKAPIGAKFNVMASYTVAKDRLDYASGTNPNDAKQWAVGGTYDLSKRTVAYASYARLNNKNDANGIAVAGGGGGSYDINGAVSQGLNSAALGQDRDSIMVGMRHSF